MNVAMMEFSIVEHMLTIIFVMLITVYAIWIVVKEIKKKRNRNVCVISAKVFSKCQLDYVNQKAYMTTGQVDLGVAEKGRVCRILFEEQGTGKQLELEVSQNVFGNIQEGASGELVYKGDVLIQFGDIMASQDGAAFVAMGK